CYVTCAWRCQISDRLTDIFRLPRTLDRLKLEGIIDAFGNRGLNRSRRNAIDGDAELADFFCDPFREGDDASFGRGISRARTALPFAVFAVGNGAAHHAGNRADIDDAPASLIDHMRI